MWDQARTLPPAGFGPPQWLATDDPYAMASLALFDRGTVQVDLNEAPYGNNMAYRKEVFERHGGFRTDLGPQPGVDCPQKGEDSEFGGRVLNSGERLCYVPSAVVYHTISPNRLVRKYFLSWSWDKARSDIRSGILPASNRTVGGVPSFLYRRLVRWAIQWLFTFDPAGRFSCKLKMWNVAGSIMEMRQRYRADPQR